MNPRECARLLQERDGYLLLTHRNPDGDTVASAAALCCALRRAGKTAWLYPNPDLTRALRPFAARYEAPSDFAPGCVVAVDVATEGLFAKGFEGEVCLCVDHHPTNSHYAQYELIRDARSSCGEIVMDLIKELCGDATPEQATLIYIAVTTDTGCFQYANTDSRTLSAAAELLRCGARGHDVARRFFREATPARLKLEGLIYSRMDFRRDGRLVIAAVTREMLRESGATEDDLDDLAGLSGRAAGCEMNVTIREQANGDCRISVRSAPGVSSVAIAAAFGGGGHEMAAGCTIAAEPERAKELLLAVIDELWP